MKSLALLLLSALCCFGQGFDDVGFVGNIQKFEQAATAEFHPTNIAGCALFFTYQDFTNQQQVSSWTDKIQAWTLTAYDDINSASYGTNSTQTGTKGIWPRRGTYLALTNANYTLPSVFSVWMVIKTPPSFGSFNTVWGSRTPFQPSMFVPCTVGTLDLHYLGHNSTESFTPLVDTYYDILWANGDVYTNGVASLASSVPANCTFGTLFSSGDGTSSPWPWYGAIKFIAFYTNTTLTAQNAADLATWSSTR